MTPNRRDLLHVDPIGADTSLARPPEFAEDSPGHSRRQIRILKHDQRCVPDVSWASTGDSPSQFQRHLLQCARAVLCEYLADSGRPGEGDLADDRIRGELLADGLEVLLACDDVEYSVWHSGSFRKLSSVQTSVQTKWQTHLHDCDICEWCFRWNLDDCCTPNSQSRPDLPRDHRCREVPPVVSYVPLLDSRYKQSADPDRLFDDEIPCPWDGTRYSIPISPQRLTREPSDEARRIIRLSESVRPALPILPDDQPHNVFDAGHEELMEFGEDVVALSWGCFAVGLKCFVGDVDGPADVLDSHLRTCTDDLPGRGVYQCISGFADMDSPSTSKVSPLLASTCFPAIVPCWTKRVGSSSPSYTAQQNTWPG